MIDRSADTCFVVLGDTGEQDASQFVVCPALSAAVRAHHPGFVLIMSDVIYPAGDVDDYRDGLYRPYRSDDPNFHVASPLLALPATTIGTTASAASCTTSAAEIGCRPRHTRQALASDRFTHDYSASCGGGLVRHGQKPGSCGPRRPRPGHRARPRGH